MTEIYQTIKNQMVKEIEERKDHIVSLAKLLKSKPSIRKDYYYGQIIELSEKDYMFESWMVINWVGLKYRPRKIIEIGTRNGGSLCALLTAYDDFNDMDITCFDIWREIGGPKAVKRNLKHFKIPNSMITFISGDSRETVPDFFQKNPDTKFDYILVDGGHDFETADTDLKNVENHVAKGGILVFDDISEESYGLLPVWEDFKKRNGSNFDYYEVMHRKGSAWAIRKED